MQRLKRMTLGLLAVGFLWLGQALPSFAAELWMFEEDGCVWCQRWRADIGDIYPKTAEGKQAPLRPFNIHREQLPSDLQLNTKPHYTPTFVLIENNQEIGRIEGYPGEDFFWGLLGQLLAKLEETAL